MVIIRLTVQVTVTHIEGLYSTSSDPYNTWNLTNFFFFLHRKTNSVMNFKTATEFFLYWFIERLLLGFLSN